MRKTTVGKSGLMSGLVVVALSVATAGAQPPAVYTAAQAQAGKVVYDRECAQ